MVCNYSIYVCNIAAFESLQAKLWQMKVIVCRLVSSCKKSVFVVYSNYLQVHGKTAESALSAVLCPIAYQFLQDAYCSIVAIICSSTAAVSLP